MKHYESRGHGLVCGVAITGAMLASAGLSQAATRYAATNGIDTGACGFSSATACRTISQAITNAAAGDTIVVGPGVYGDVDHDGVLEPGEEAGGIVDSLQVTIRIAKSVKVVSRDGTGSSQIVTVENFGGAAVGIDAPGVTFGQKGKGFSIMLPADPDDESSGILIAADGAIVEGNVVSCNLVEESNGIRVLESVQATIRFNRIRQCRGSGVYIEQGDGVVASNVVQGMTDGGIDVDPVGAVIIEKNISVGNYRGIRFDGNGAPVLVRRNVVLGNENRGVEVSGLASGISLTANSIFGNDPGGSCGLRTSVSDVALAAAGNYWGSPAGPGTDPADGVCDIGAFSSVTTPFVPSEIKVKATPLR